MKCCSDCLHYDYDYYPDGDWDRICIYEEETEKLPSNPFNEYKEWDCPYFKSY